MKLLILSDWLHAGGAAVAGRRLGEALAGRGHEVTWTCDQPAPDLPGRMVGLSPERPVLEALLQRATPANWRPGLQRRRVNRRFERLLASSAPEGVLIHNLHAAAWKGWTIDLVNAAQLQAPTVWTLHDMWSFTGRCAYAGSCRKFPTGCDADCPTPDQYPALPPHQIAAAWQDRRHLDRNARQLTLVCPSEWLAGEARRGLWRHAPVRVIPNGLPLDTFQPFDKSLARTALGLPDDEKPVLLSSAADLADPRKNVKALHQALAERPLHVHWVTLGPGTPPGPPPPGVTLHPLGRMDHPRVQALAYNAADLVVHPAREENLPNIIAESLACGTPVLAGAVGGIPEMIQPDETGWLVPTPDAPHLARALAEILPRLRPAKRWQNACRTAAETRYDIRTRAREYEALWRPAP